MNEIKHLKSMWAPRIKRSLSLIVPKVEFSKEKRSLNNEHWKFSVSYAFREALDLKFEKRMKNKKPYMVWTQGAILRFKDGDLLHAKNGSKLFQINFATPMGWDKENEKMYLGLIQFDEYDRNNCHVKRKTCNQMEFLEVLIYGEKQKKLTSASKTTSLSRASSENKLCATV